MKMSRHGCHPRCRYSVHIIIGKVLQIVAATDGYFVEAIEAVGFVATTVGSTICLLG